MKFQSVDTLHATPLSVPLNTGWLGPASASMDLLFLVLVAAVLLAMLRRILRLAVPGRRAAARAGRSRRAASPARGETPDRTQRAARQMAAVDANGFDTVPLMNKSEYRIFRALETTVRASAGGHRLMAQTSLQELVRPTGSGSSLKAANYAIMAKRLDFAVIDSRGHLVVAIEYQGGGHHQNGAFMRDAIKREIVRKAGADWLELPADIAPESAAARLQALLRPPCQSGLPPRREPPRAFPPLAT